VSLSPGHPTPLPPESDSPRIIAIRKVVEQCMSRRAAGEALGDQSIVASHTELMPELGRELALLSLIERAKSRSGSRSDARFGPRPSDQPSTPEAPIGYDFIREIHRGGQGVVHEAVQRATGRRVAVKVQHESLLPGSTSVDRFEREVEILAQLDHPNIVGVIDSGVHMGRPYYVMDFVDGCPLDEHLAAASLDVRSLMALFEKISAAVAAAHVRGVIHRDLKPANILVDQTGEPRLVDFGLARMSASPEHERRTMSGQFLGSFPWASPEQASGNPSKIDVRSDVYSLGVVLFQMLTGVLPYRLPSLAGGEGTGGLREALAVIASVAPTRPSAARKGLNPDIDTIVLKCLNKEPARRYQSAAELTEDIRRHLEHRPISARPNSVAYQLRRFARRNRVLVVAAAAVALALTIGSISTLVQLGRARAAERVAESRRAQAERQAYQTSIFAAEAALKAFDGRTARALLAAAPIDRHGWEWGYLNTQADQSVLINTSPEPVAFLQTLGDHGALLAFGKSGTLRRTDTRAGTTTWATMIGTPYAMATSLEGRRAAVSVGNGVVVVDTETGAIIRRTALTQTIDISSIALSGDGTRLVMAGRDTFGIQICQTDSGTPIVQSSELFSHVRSVDITPDGSRVASVEIPDLVVRAADTLKVLFTCPLGSAKFGGIASTVISPDGKLVAVTRIENILLFSMEDGHRLGVLRGHTQFVTDLRFTPDGTSLISCSQDATVRVWDLATQVCTRVLLGHTEQPQSACFDPGTGMIFSASPKEPGPRAWPPIAGSISLPIESVVSGHGLGFAPEVDGSIYKLRDDDVVRINPTASNTPLAPPLVIGSWSNVMPDRTGRFVSVAGDDQTLSIWDLHSAKRISTCIRPSTDQRPSSRNASDKPYSLSTDGRLVAMLPKRTNDQSLADRRPALILEPSTGRELLIEIPGGAGGVTFASGGRDVVTAGFDWAVRVWDSSTGAERFVLEMADAEHRNVAMAACPNSRLLATGDQVGNIRVWDLADGRALAVCGQSGSTTPPPTSPTLALAFSPDGLRVVAGGVDGTIHLYDTQTGDKLLAIRGLTSFVDDLRFSPDGRWLLSSMHEGETRVWDGGAGKPPAPQSHPAK